ncbi:MAG: hypothetical protein NPIRA03_07920 [Nitrospirales bacterium]|nr:MAG: hypothetical protein NPIRA03_07920 [Nitrospirales bacterium]
MGCSPEDITGPTDVYWGDVFAIALQELRSQGKVSDARPLLRIDAQTEAAMAPYQFDPVYGKLHRRGCSNIADDSRSALFARWSMGFDEQFLACSHCRPHPYPRGQEAQDVTLDILFGVISILDQFGTVLRERGKEYRTSSDGQELERKLEDLYQNLDRQQKDTIEVMLHSMDQMVKFLREADRNLSQVHDKPVNGHRQMNGHGMAKKKPNGTETMKAGKGNGRRQVRRQDSRKSK